LYDKPSIFTRVANLYENDITDWGLNHFWIEEYFIPQIRLIAIQKQGGLVPQGLNVNSNDDT
jgi:hypothetical protein